MSNGVHQANELSLICSQLGMLWVHRFAEKGNGTLPLMQNNAETCPGRVTFHHEGLVEVGQLQHRDCCQCLLEGVECLGGRR